MFNFLNGYKTILGMIGAVATFILVITGALSDGFQFSTDIDVIVGGLTALMLALGLGHKMQKIEKLLGK